MTDYPGAPVASDAPDTMICAVDIVRSMIQPDSDPPDPLPPIWTIYGEVFKDEGDHPAILRLFGDLSLFEGGWFVGVTSVVGVIFRDGDNPAPDDDWSTETVNAAVMRLGGWASHVLWDTATGCARRLAAQSFVAGPAVPIATPPAELILD